MLQAYVGIASDTGWYCLRV